MSDTKRVLALDLGLAPLSRGKEEATLEEIKQGEGHSEATIDAHAAAGNVEDPMAAKLIDPEEKGARSRLGSEQDSNDTGCATAPLALRLARSTNSIPGAIAMPGIGSRPRSVVGEESVGTGTPANQSVELVTADLVGETDMEQELRLELERIRSAPKAIVVERSNSSNRALVALGMVLVTTVAIIAIFSTDESPESTQRDRSPDTKLLQPTLEAIKERGVIRCRVESNEREQGYGLSIDLCRALAAAIFGDPAKIELPLVQWPDMWLALYDGTLDVSTSMATFNMGRDVYEARSRLPLSFSTPWFFSGTLLAGVPEFVECADRGDTLSGVCRDVVVCSHEGSSNNEVIQTHLDGSGIVLVKYSDELFQGLSGGLCNVVVGEVPMLSEKRAREAGYTGPYVLGNMVHSLEPLALASRGDDPQWADFCDAVLQSLFTAEMENIAAENSTRFPQTRLFGGDHQNMFRDAIAAGGNWGQLYERHYSESVTRRGANLPYRPGSTPQSALLYSPPFGTLDFDLDENDELPGRLADGALRRMEERGLLRCGIIPNRPGFVNSLGGGLNLKYHHQG